MITEHWTNHILQTNIDNDEYVAQLYEHILCNVPFEPYAPNNFDVRETLLDEFQDGDKLFDTFKECVQKQVNEYISQVYGLDSLDHFIKTFLVTNKIHSRTQFHNHRGAFITGVFYVNVDELSGDLLLHDPRFNAVRSTPLEISKTFEPVVISPKNGDIVIFPSFVYHETNINFSEFPRILIPFDVYIASS